MSVANPETTPQPNRMGSRARGYRTAGTLAVGLLAATLSGCGSGGSEEATTDSPQTVCSEAQRMAFDPHNQAFFVATDENEADVILIQKDGDEARMATGSVHREDIEARGVIRLDLSDQFGDFVPIGPETEFSDISFGGARADVDVAENAGSVILHICTETPSSTLAS